MKCVCIVKDSSIEMKHGQGFLRLKKINGYARIAKHNLKELLVLYVNIAVDHISESFVQTVNIGIKSIMEFFRVIDPYLSIMSL